MPKHQGLLTTEGETSMSATKSTYEGGSRSANETIGRLGDDVATMADHAQVTVSEQVDKLSNTIRSKPLQSAAIAAGLGFLFALIARR
jgi:ElaB/YqjD/DUF883 family membrane-anchored ribosome-binding protein